MRLSVLIPTRGRPGLLTGCVRSLLAQTLAPDAYEVLVGVDAGATVASASSEAAVPKAEVPEANVQEARALGELGILSGSPRVRVLALPDGGPAATRNALLREATGELVLFLNDDVVASPDLLRAHASAHAPGSRSGPAGALVLGDAPWRVHADDTLFDRFIRETPAVFFYSEMTAAAPDRDWGPRHAWTLNLSVPRTLALREGGFDERLTRPMFEDLEWAHRLGAPVLYRPGAIVEHDHRLTPTDYLRRERALGAEAVHLARIRPAFARELFGRDLLDPRERDYAQMALERERGDVAAVRERFFAMADRPASSIGGPDARERLRVLFEHHRPLKRYAWRQGLVEAFAGERVGMDLLSAA